MTLRDVWDGSSMRERVLVGLNLVLLLGWYFSSGGGAHVSGSSASLVGDSIVLFGDSLTQTCDVGSLYQRMARAYERKLDVVNRGYSGFTSSMSLQVYPDVFPTLHSASSESASSSNIRLMTIWLGTNDASDPSNPQHVSLEQFESNMEEIIRRSRSSESQWYDPNIKLVLMTPGPFAPDMMREIIHKDRNLANRNHKPYVEMVEQIAKRERLPVVNVYNEIVRAAGGDSEALYSRYYYDGLHFNADGNRIVFDAVMRTVEQHYPELMPRALREPIPHWRSFVGLPESDP